MSGSRRIIAAALAGAILIPALASAQRRKKKQDEEPVTQTLEVAPDPPLALTVDTKRLVFHTVPMSVKGLLSQQVRDGLKALQRLASNQPIVKVRAFVAGTGDLRRVQTIVAEELSERKLALPVISVVQVGALPLEGAQVQLEAVTQDNRRTVPNPHGLAFISGQDIEPQPPVGKLAAAVEKSFQQLKTALAAANADPLRVTCFVTSLEDIDQQRIQAAALLPGTAVAFLQTQRAPERPVAECEAVGRLKAAPAEPLSLLNPAGLRQSPNYSQVAVVAAPRIVLAGAQLAFRYQDDDARLAFQRLGRTLTAAGSSLPRVFMMNTYPLSPQLGDLVRKVRFEFLDPKRPPASTLLPFEGLPGMDAAFSLEVIALPN